MIWNFTQLSVRVFASPFLVGQFLACLIACSTNAAQEPSTNPASKDQSSPIASSTVSPTIDEDDDDPKNNLKTEQAKSITELSEEETAEVRAAERFFSILEKNPRRGTAFDRVYSHHIDFGTLEKLLVTLRERTQKTPEDGIAWQLLGLFELHRGQHQAAVKQLIQAEKLRDSDPLASYYLGLAQAADGDLAAAVGSLQRAIERKPQRTELLEIYQQLGRFHLRAQRIDEALAAWKRLEELFPNDPRVLEEIAVALVQEEKLDLAKQHYTRLLPVLRDDFKRSSIQIQIAELTTQLGDKASGIAQLENVLSSLKPDSWLFRDVRRRIDETFLKAKDQDGHVKYYEYWLAGHGDDLDAMSRLARFLNSVGRSKEAMEWSEKAIKLAPTLVELRKSHILLLVESSQYEQAIEQYRQLTQLEPANIDHLKQWGVLIMRQSRLPEDQRGQQALDVWRRIIEKSPEDAVTVSQVADLCLQHKLFEPAETYYRQALKLAPDDVQYREYLGEFLHRQKRVDEALVVWSEITSGSRETSSNLARVAEIYNNFGFTEKANSAIARAAELSPKDFQLQVLAAKMHNRSGAQYTASQFITTAESLASDSEERDLVIAERIASLQGTKSLASEASRLELQLQEASVAEDQKPNNAETRSQQYYRLARYWEACRQWNSARKAADKAIALEPRELAPRILCGRIAELTKEYAEAAKIYRELASVDRRSRAAHWMKVSEIELLTGNHENAVEAAQQVVQSAPNVSANYEFYSNVCLKAGKVDQAIAALRKAIRAQPRETVLLMSLAKSLAETKRTEEAIETYFRALEKSDDVEDMLEIVKRLTPLYQTSGSIYDLVDRLEADRKLPEMERKIAICLAQIWRSQGNLRKARQQLEELYTEESKDTILLNQLSKLCQEAGETQSAINYQRKLVAIAPGAETELPLANLLYEAGKDDEAREITIRLLLQDPDPVHQLAGIDNLIKRKDWLTSSQILDSLVARYPNDWEFLFRAAVTQYYSGNHDESARLFRRVLALNLPLTTLGRREAERTKNERRKSTSSQTAATDSVVLPSLQQLKAISNTLGFVTTTPQQFYPTQMSQLAFGGQSAPSQSRFAPADFLQVRLASLVCLKSMHSDFQEYTEGLKGKPSEAPSHDLMRAYDRLFVAVMRDDHDEQLDVAKEAAALGGDSERMLLLEAIQQSVQPQNDDEEELLITSTIRGVPGLAVPSAGDASNETPPPKLLSTADLQLAIETYLAIDPQALEQRSTIGLNSLLGSYSLGNRQIILSTGNRGFVYATVGGPFFEAHTLPIFLLTQARFSSNTVALAKLEEHILKNCLSPSLVMHVLCKKIVQTEPESIQPWLTKWKELSEKSILQQQANSNSGNVPFANSNIGEAEIYRLVAAPNNRISPQSLRDLLSVVLPVYFQQSQTRHDLNLSSMTVNSSVDRNPTLMPYRSELSLITQLVSSRSSVIESSALTQFLREQRDKSTTAEDRACWDVCMAGLEYGSRRFPSCAEYMQRVVGAFPEDDAMKLALANVLELDGKYFEALQTIKQIAAKDLRLKNHLDLCMIRLAIRLGDRQLAMPLAEQLYAQQLQPDQADQLTTHLLSLGMQEQAQALVAKRQATIQTRAAAVRSSSQSGQVLSSGASQFGEKQALQYLATSSCEVGMDEIPMAFFTWRARTDGSDGVYTTNLGRIQVSAGAMASNTMPTASNRMRIQSLQYLANNGKLKALDEKVVEELKQTPESFSKWALRLEYQLYLSNEDLNPTLRRLVELRPNSRAFRFMLARNQEKAEVTDEIFEVYVQLLREHPAWTILALRNAASKIYSTDSQRQTYARALLEIDPALLRDSIDSVSLCKSLIRSEDTRSLGLELFQHLSKGYKSQLIALQSQFLNDKSKSLWDIPEFFDLFVKAMLPEESRIRKDPWAMAFFLGSNMTTETIVSGSARKQQQQNMFERFLLELKYERVLSWKSALQKHIDEHSQWQGGQLLMIQTESHLGLEKELVDRLSTLIDKEVFTKVNDVYVISWLTNLSQTSIKIPSRLEAKILLQIARNPIASTAGMSGRLLQLCAQSGQSSEVRTILSDLSQGSQVVEVAETQIKLGYVLDALRLLLPIKPPNDIAMVDSRTTNALRQATLNKSTQAFSNDVRVSLDFNDALAKSRSVWPAAQVADQIFIATSQDSSAVCDLLVLLPKPADVFTTPISSPVFEQFVLAVEKSEGGDKLLQQLKQLVASKPDDLRLSKLDLLWQIHKEQATTEEIVNQTQPLISGPNSNPDAITLDDALELWLVAANLMKSKKYREVPEVISVATQLAQAALQKARENRLVNYEVSMLGQWASILASQGQTKMAEEKCREVLVALSRSNPDGLRASGEAKHRSIAYGVPQFLQAMALAAFAHKLGAEELRIETLKQALGEKLPIAEAEVSKELRDLVASHRGQPMSKEMLSILKLAVFPENSMKLVRFHAIMRDRTNIEVENVALELVARAAEMNQLDSLSEENQQRGEDRLNHLAMKVLIALKRNQDMEAKPALEEMLSLISERKPMLTASLAATIAAKQSLENPELAGVAKDILVKQGLRPSGK